MADLDPDTEPRLGPTEAVLASARIAGLRDFETPTLEQIERRRFELFLLAFIVLVALAAGLVFLSSAVIDLPRWVRDLGATATAVRIGFVLLAILFGLYVAEKERHLRRLASALVNERVLSAALQNRLKEISSLSEAGKAVVSALELEEMLHVILNAAFDLLGADEGSVQLLEDEELVVAAATGHAESYIGDRTPVTRGLSGYVATNREPLLIEGDPDPDEFGFRLTHREEDVHSAVSVPLEAKGQLLGVLNLNMTATDRRFTEYDLRALSLFGEQAAMAVRHARALRTEKDLRARIADLDRIRSELIGTMTHDLKTPLTTILGSARLLLSRPDEIDEGRRREALESIERQAQRQLALIDRLLEASRSQVGHSLTPRRIDLVREVEELARAYAGAHDRKIVVTKEDDRVEAFIDPEGFEHVLGNLLENAVRHTPPTAGIELRVGSRGATAEVVVSDEGPGIPASVKEHLFEPFRRGERGSGGVGLGLYIVANVTRSMGGEVSVTSEPGRGTSFTLSLPTDDPREAAT